MTCPKCGTNMYHENLKDDDCPLFVQCCGKCGYTVKA